MEKSHKIAYALYLLIWIVMAINPKYPEDWLLENVLVFLFFPFIIYMDYKNRYTLLSIVFLLVFAFLHALGSHYTYAEMEHFDVITAFFGFERNHFDRVVHFAFGLLLFRILFEMINPKTHSLKVALLFTFTTVVTIATFYEQLEWFAVIAFHPELGSAFLGTQGDSWDAHQDTLVAIVGAATNMLFYRSYGRLLERRKKK